MENNKFIDEISKCKNEKTYKFNKIILKNTINIFLILSFFIMVAGFSSYFKQEFKIPIIISSSVIGIIIYIIFLNDIEGIMKINEKIIPILIIILVYIIIKSPIEIIKENVNIENNLIEYLKKGNKNSLTELLKFINISSSKYKNVYKSYISSVSNLTGYMKFIVDEIEEKIK